MANPKDEQDLQRWMYPDLTDPASAKEERTNALNKPLRWKYEPPEEEHADSDEPKPLTAEELEEIRQAARDEGFTEGHSEGQKQGHEEGFAKGLEEGRQSGHEQGFEAGKEEGVTAQQEITEAWQQLLNHAYSPLEIVDKQVEQQLLDMVLELSRAICLHEVKQSTDSIRQAIQQGIDALPLTEQKILIKLHPDDLERVRDAFGTEYIESQGWQFAKDEHMAPGGCEITTDTSTVDMSIRRRIETVFERVVGERRKEDREDD